MKKVNVINVWNGDWNENYMNCEVWDYWSEWYGVKGEIEKDVEGYEWNGYCGEEVSGKEWLEISKKMEVENGGWWIDICIEDGEFGRRCFNLDMMLKMDMELKGLKFDDDNWFLIDEEGKEWEICSGNGEYDEDMEWLLVSDSKWENFGLIKKIDYEKMRDC